MDHKFWGDFCGITREGMRQSGISLREMCRRTGTDPSLMSKVLSGKRNPPLDDETIAKMSEALELDPACLFVALGKLPPAWRRICRDHSLFEKADTVITGANHAAAAQPGTGQRDIPEELL
jgi:transcriptional regulator with XRE-family HTH domain